MPYGCRDAPAYPSDAAFIACIQPVRYNSYLIAWPAMLQNRTAQTWKQLFA